ncbi:hypothetical protein BGX26_011440 [Mortierella sp. AD094]|nr:hypothetical protein BGX26_011440 [Mortierella sp. AD094]
MNGGSKSSPSPQWAKAQRVMRLWVFLLTLLTGLSVIVYYILYSHLNLFQLAYGRLVWQDIATMILSLANFITYSYALCGKPGTKPDLRAFLIFFLAILYLYLPFRAFGLTNLHWDQSFPVNGGDSPDAPRKLNVDNHTCQPAIPACVMYFVTAWFMLFTGLSMILEIILTLKVGPMRSQGQYGRDGYKNEANVIVVSPEAPQGMFLNQQFQPQPSMTTAQMYSNSHQTGFVPTAPGGYKLEAPTHLVEASQ